MHVINYITLNNKPIKYFLQHLFKYNIYCALEHHYIDILVKYMYYFVQHACSIAILHVFMHVSEPNILISITFYRHSIYVICKMGSINTFRFCNLVWVSTLCDRLFYGAESIWLEILVLNRITIWPKQTLMLIYGITIEQSHSQL